MCRCIVRDVDDIAELVSEILYLHVFTILAKMMEGWWPQLTCLAALRQGFEKDIMGGATPAVPVAQPFPVAQPGADMMALEGELFQNS